MFSSDGFFFLGGGGGGLVVPPWRLPFVSLWDLGNFQMYSFVIVYVLDYSYMRTSCGSVCVCVAVGGGSKDEGGGFISEVEKHFSTLDRLSTFSSFFSFFFFFFYIDSVLSLKYYNSIPTALLSVKSIYINCHSHPCMCAVHTRIGFFPLQGTVCVSLSVSSVGEGCTHDLFSERWAERRGRVLFTRQENQK